jgi:alkanesulfonate monooxygenase SsuD/methylene tetrahydromethanopterin reductase-like flavin-dependent oxidoreductase (luciferase family)
MRISLLFSGFAPIADTLPLVRAAERIGLDGVWYAEHLGMHDAVVPAAAALATTERLHVGLVGPALVARHPGLLALELASLAELGPGRVRVQVGTGHPAFIARLGGDVQKPVARVEALVQALRRLLAGEPLSGEHAGYSFAGYQMARYGPGLEIDVMAIRPRMLRASARIGDGVGLSAGASRHYLSECVASLEAELRKLERERSSFRITAFQLAAVRPTADEAGATIAAHLPLFGAELLRLLGPDVFGTDDAPPPTPGPAEGRRMGLAATPDELTTALESFAATGVDELSLELLGSPNEQLVTIEALQRALPR